MSLKTVQNMQIEQVLLRLFCFFRNLLVWLKKAEMFLSLKALFQV